MPDSSQPKCPYCKGETFSAAKVKLGGIGGEAVFIHCDKCGAIIDRDDRFYHSTEFRPV
jgi:transcription elongation factor Elf1